MKNLAEKIENQENPKYFAEIKMQDYIATERYDKKVGNRIRDLFGFPKDGEVKFKGESIVTNVLYYGGIICLNVIEEKRWREEKVKSSFIITSEVHPVKSIFNKIKGFIPGKKESQLVEED